VRKDKHDFHARGSPLLDTMLMIQTSSTASAAKLRLRLPHGSHSGTDTYSVKQRRSVPKGRSTAGERQVAGDGAGHQCRLWEWTCEKAHRGDYLDRMLDKKAGNVTGKIYGIGHAIYTLSDPVQVVIRAARSSWRRRAVQTTSGLVENYRAPRHEKSRRGATDGLPLMLNVRPLIPA
jgi:hypothetical protein